MSTSPSPSVVAAASTLAAWAHERRRTWSAEPLPRPVLRVAIKKEVRNDVKKDVKKDVQPDVKKDFQAEVQKLIKADTWMDVAIDIQPEPDVVSSDLSGDVSHSVSYDAVELYARDAVAAAEPVPVELSLAESALAIAFTLAHKTGAAMTAALKSIQPLGAYVVPGLMRGSALVSTMSVLLFIGVNRSAVLERLDRTSAKVSAVAIGATSRPASALPQAKPAKGNGRLSITSPSGAAQVVVDGTPRGLSPVTVELPAGLHRVLLKSANGSVERSVRVDAGESADVDESIFPGWLAVTAAMDLTLSEGSQPLSRDERGWAILPPGPHDVRFRNRALGVSEIRHVVVKPGEATWFSFVPQASR